MKWQWQKYICLYDRNKLYGHHNNIYMSLSTKCRTKATYPLIGKTIELLKVDLEIMTEPEKS